MNIQELLVVTREHKNITQEELGEEMGIANRKLSKWEMGEFNPDLSELRILSVYFDLDIAEIVEESKSDREEKEQVKIVMEEVEYRPIIFVMIIMFCVLLICIGLEFVVWTCSLIVLSSLLMYFYGYLFIHWNLEDVDIYINKFYN